MRALISLIELILEKVRTNPLLSPVLCSLLRIFEFLFAVPVAALLDEAGHDCVPFVLTAPAERRGKSAANQSHRSRSRAHCYCQSLGSSPWSPLASESGPNFPGVGAGSPRERRR